MGINYNVKMNGILDTGLGEAEGLDKLMEEINDYRTFLLSESCKRKNLREISLNVRIILNFFLSASLQPQSVVGHWAIWAFFLAH